MKLSEVLPAKFTLFFVALMCNVCSRAKASKETVENMAGIRRQNFHLLRAHDQRLTKLPLPRRLIRGSVADD